MIRLPILLLSLLFFISGCNGQTKIAEVVEKKNSNNQYQDFAYDGERIWGLTTEGKLALFDAINGDPISGKVKNDSPIIVLANDRDGNIFIGDESKTYAAQLNLILEVICLKYYHYALKYSMLNALIPRITVFIPSTSHQLSWWINCFVTHNPSSRQAPIVLNFKNQNGIIPNKRTKIYIIG